jgi:hypothetical protein
MEGQAQLRLSHTIAKRINLRWACVNPIRRGITKERYYHFLRHQI